MYTMDKAYQLQRTTIAGKDTAHSTQHTVLTSASHQSSNACSTEEQAVIAPVLLARGGLTDKVGVGLLAMHPESCLVIGMSSSFSRVKQTQQLVLLTIPAMYSSQ